MTFGNIYTIDVESLGLNPDDFTTTDTIIIHTPKGNFGFRKTHEKEDLIALSKAYVTHGTIPTKVT